MTKHTSCVIETSTVAQDAQELSEHPGVHHWVDTCPHADRTLLSLSLLLQYYFAEHQTVREGAALRSLVRRLTHTPSVQKLCGQILLGIFALLTALLTLFVLLIVLELIVVNSSNLQLLLQLLQEAGLHVLSQHGHSAC